MRKLFLLILLLAGCSSEWLMTGDLVFVAAPGETGTGSISDAIVASTSKDSLNIIHVGIISVDGGLVSVLDATGERGVAIRSLDEFYEDFRLDDGSLPEMIVKRLDDNSRAEEYVGKALRYVGEPYDDYFMHDNGAHYCSELVYDSYVKEDGTRIFPSVSMNFKAADGTYPEYWEKLFGELGVPVPQGAPGTNPQAMFLSPELHTVCQLPPRRRTLLPDCRRRTLHVSE
ncbi:MAG: hypothetical protein IK022_07035 [Bacteroidales bacterium]|nr:hypothetical protein [Bacteroidales bacterium]